MCPHAVFVCVNNYHYFYYIFRFHEVRVRFITPVFVIILLLFRSFTTRRSSELQLLLHSDGRAIRRLSPPRHRSGSGSGRKRRTCSCTSFTRTRCCCGPRARWGRLSIIYDRNRPRECKIASRTRDGRTSCACRYRCDYNTR